MKRLFFFALLLLMCVWQIEAQDTLCRAAPWYYSEESNPLELLENIHPIGHDNNNRWFYADNIIDDFFRECVIPDSVEYLYGIAVTAYNFPVDDERLGMTPIMGLHLLEARSGDASDDAYFLLRIFDSLSVLNLRKDCYFNYELDGATPETNIVVPTTELYFDRPYRLDSLPDTFCLSLCWEDGCKQRYIDWIRSQYSNDSLTSHVFTPQMARYSGILPSSLGYSGALLYGMLNGEYFYSNGYEYVITYDMHAYLGMAVADMVPWGFLFPIVKLRCTVPKMRQVQYSDVGAATLNWWQAERGESYQLSVGPYGSAPDTGMMMSTTDTFYTVGGLEPDAIYQAWVRKACRYTTAGYDTLVWSDWSRPTTFRASVGISAVEGDAAFTLSPNPAHGTVVLTLEQAAEGAELTLCDLGGRELRHERVTGASYTLDIATLPAGVYFLKLTTPQGVATRRLLVE